jgi:hypothetical protein
MAVLLDVTAKVDAHSRKNAVRRPWNRVHLESEFPGVCKQVALGTWEMSPVPGLGALTASLGISTSIENK